MLLIGITKANKGRVKQGRPGRKELMDYAFRNYRSLHMTSKIKFQLQITYVMGKNRKTIRTKSPMGSLRSE